MNLLKNTKTYLIGPMENDADGQDWREYMEERLNSLFGVKCFNPYKQAFINCASESLDDIEKRKKWRMKGKFDELHIEMQEVIKRDLRLIDLSTFIVCNIDPNRPTWGTVHELVLASLQFKPILVRIKDKAQMPIWLCGLLDHNLFFESFDDIIQYLDGVDKGKIPVSFKYWKFLKEEFR